MVLCVITVTLEMCATVAGEGWLPGKMWELVYCKGKVQQVSFFHVWNSSYFAVQQAENLHMASDSASATRHFSTRCGSIFSPL